MTAAQNFLPEQPVFLEVNGLRAYIFNATSTVKPVSESWVMRLASKSAGATIYQVTAGNPLYYAGQLDQFPVGGLPRNSRADFKVGLGRPRPQQWWLWGSSK